MKFRGASAISLDSKGRLAIPARYREMLMNQCGGRLVCTIDVASCCLMLYPLPEWEMIETKLQGLSSTNPQERSFKRLLIGHAADCEMDKNGRFLLPAPLRKYAKLDKSIMLVGQLNKFEIWAESAWHDQMEQDMAEHQAADMPLSDNLLDLNF